MSSNLDLIDTREPYPAQPGSDPRLAPPKQTRRVYDIVAPVYSVSSLLFHSRAHKKALALSELQDGSRVLELAMGSGEMFHRLVQANPNGQTIGFDFSVNMAARSQVAATNTFPGAFARCICADARRLPFPDGYFDTLVCCYLFELLTPAEGLETIREIVRVLKPGGALTLTLVGQHVAFFNLLYKVCTKVAPAFWGRQVTSAIPEKLTAHGFVIESTSTLRQGFYPTRLLRARKPA